MPTVVQKHAKTKHVALDGSVTEVYTQTDDKSIIITSANENIPDNIGTLEELEDELGALAFEDEIEIPVATTTQAGVTMLSNATTDTTPAAATKAATSKAVNDVNAGAVHTTGDENVAGVKTFTSGEISLGGLSMSYDSVTGELRIGAAQASGS